jgi:uroporphyrinogen-III synthase
MHLLVTRPIDEAEATRRALVARGHSVMVDPMLTITARAAPLPAGPFDAVLVTSGNAVAHAGGLAPLLGLPLLAVGLRTAEAARSAGFTDVTSTGRDAAAMVGHIAERWSGPRRVLYLAGADRATDMAAALAPLGHAVTVAVVYDATKAVRLAAPTRLALTQGTIDAVLHYSARTAETYAALSADIVDRGAPRPLHLCLSAKVAEALRHFGERNLAVAVRPDEDALFALLEG